MQCELLYTRLHVVYVYMINVLGLNHKIMMEFCMHTVCYGTRVRV